MEEDKIETCDSTEVALSNIFIEQLQDQNDSFNIVQFFERISDNYDDYEKFNSDFSDYMKNTTISYGHKILIGIIFLGSVKLKLRNAARTFILDSIKHASSHDEDFALTLLEKFDFVIKSKLLTYVSLSVSDQICERFKMKILNFIRFKIKDPKKNKLAKCLSIKEIYCSRTKEIDNNHYVIDALMKQGHEVTHSLKNCQDSLMEMINHISPMTVSEAFVDFSTDLMFECGWRSDIFIEAIKKIFPDFDYVSLVQCFDLISWRKPSLECIGRIVHIYSTTFQAAFPVKIFYQCWNDYDIMLLFVEFSLKHPSELSFVVHPFTPVHVSISHDNRENGVVSNWHSFDFIQLLLEVYSHRPTKVRELLKHGISKYCDYIMFGIFQQDNFSLDDSSRVFLGEVISYYLEHEKHGSEYLKFIWSYRDTEPAIQELMIQVMQEYFASSLLDVENRVSRILNVAQSLNAITTILKNSVVGFAIELAILASKRNFVSLPIWMSEQVIQYKDMFLSSLIGYIRHHYHVLCGSSSIPPSSLDISDVQSNWSVIDELISFIMEHYNLLCENDQKNSKTIYSRYKMILENSSTTKTISCDRNKLETASQNINSLFNYCGSTQSFEDRMACIDEFVKNICSDNSPESKTLLNHTLELIMDPSHYSYYNEFNLHTVGCLIGRLVQLEIVEESRVLSLVDRLLSANPVGSSLFYMAAVIIYSNPHFLRYNREIVTSWCESHYFLSLSPMVRIYCYAASINYHTPYHDQLYSSVEDNIRNLIRSQNYINVMTQKNDPNNFEYIRPKSELTMYFQRHDPESNLNIPKKRLYNYISPENDSFRRISRLINSLTLVNVQDIVNAIKMDVKPENIPWLARLIVRERVSLHDNLHQTYLAFIQDINDYQLEECIRYETNEYIIELFSRPTLKKNKIERDSIRNLGTWFGLLTIAQNKPVLYYEIDIKILIIEGMYKGQEDLCVIIPFVKNFVITSIKSIIYTSANPYIIAIMSVLAELCLKTDLRSNLQIEIESLFRHLKINIRSVNPSKYMTVADWMTNAPKYLHWTDLELNCVLNKFTIDPDKYLHYGDVDVTCLSNILNYINLQNCPEEHCAAVSEALTNLVRELGIWVLDRVCKVVTHLVDVVIKQDFRLDTDESHLLFASHVFSKSVALSYAGVLLKGTYFTDISKRIRVGVETGYRKSVLLKKQQIEKENIDMTVYTICQDNIEALFCFISKSCAEKIVSAVDKRLSVPDINIQQKEIQGDTRRATVSEQQNPAEVLPEKLRLRPGTPTQAQMSVYHSFNVFIPGFAPSSGTQYLENQILLNDNAEKVPTLKLSDHHCDILFGSLNLSLKNLYSCVSTFTESNPLFDQLIHLIHASLPSIQSRELRFLSGFISKLIQLYFGSLLILKNSGEPKGFLLPDLVFGIFVALKHTKLIDKWLETVITNSIFEFNLDIKYNMQIISSFIHHELICIREIDTRTAYEVATGKVPESIEFSMNFCKKFLVDRQFYGIVTEFNLTLLLDTLTQLTSQNNNPGDNGGLDQNDQISSDVVQENGKMENPDVINGDSEFLSSVVVEQLLREWVKYYYTKCQANPDSNFTTYLKILSQHNVVKNEESILKFLQTCFEIIIELSYKIPDTSVLLRVFQIIDSYSHLVIMTLKYFSSTVSSFLPCKMNLFNKVLCFIDGMLYRDACTRAEPFRPFVYERLLIGFIVEITRPDAVLCHMHNSLFVCFSGFIHSISNHVYPLFVYSLLAILGHRSFMKAMLSDQTAFKNRILYRVILCDLLNFISPFISMDQSALPQSIESVTEGLIRIFLVLLHDFPSFLFENYIYLVLYIPENCIQMRNIVLCASPSDIIFPKSTINVENISSLPLPQINWTISGNIPLSFIKVSEMYLSTKNNEEFELILWFLKAPHNADGLKYYSKYFIHYSFFLFNNFLASMKAANKKITVDSVKCSPHMVLISNIVREFDKQGKFYFISSMANHIRYPNICTKYFIIVILQLFLISDEITREVIARVLLERVICAPPHPWGIVHITNSLLKSQDYRFFQNHFVHSNPVLLSIYESLAQKTHQSVSFSSTKV